MNGELALPTISTPPGAMVKLSGCDFASPIRIPWAKTAGAKLVIKMRAAQTARHRARETGIVKSPRTIFVSSIIIQLAHHTFLHHDKKGFPILRAFLRRVGTTDLGLSHLPLASHPHRCHTSEP